MAVGGSEIRPFGYAHRAHERLIEFAPRRDQAAAVHDGHDWTYFGRMISIDL